MLRSVTYQNVLLKDHFIISLVSGAQIDFGGIAKGYAAEAVCKLLSSHRVEGAILDLGGNVLALESRTTIRMSISDVSITLGVMDLLPGPVDAALDCSACLMPQASVFFIAMGDMISGGVRMEIRVLRYFLTVVREESITKGRGCFAHYPANSQPSDCSDGGRIGY